MVQGNIVQPHSINIAGGGTQGRGMSVKQLLDECGHSLWKTDVVQHIDALFVPINFGLLARCVWRTVRVQCMLNHEVLSEGIYIPVRATRMQALAGD